ncbi:MAG: FAD-binding oxidoreductase [Pirellulales bacterium]
MHHAERDDYTAARRGVRSTLAEYPGDEGMKVDDLLPVKTIHAPTDPAAVVDIVRDCIASRTPIYPIGGGAALDFGLPAKTPGVGLSLAGLSRVIDYPARDMTVTVEAGIRINDLQKLLAIERQRLPIDAPQADQATLGGIIATNTSGPRRYANGTLRDYAIGISAVDGHGTTFKAGGRVVKNVAGYDFCKLLTGSLGTLAVITQVTLKVKPIPERSAVVVTPFRDVNHAESLLNTVSQSRTAPAAIELLVGPAWKNDPALGDLLPGQRGFIAVGLEGTEPEVRWMIATLIEELSSVGNARSLPAVAGGVPEAPSDVATSTRPTERHRGRSLQSDAREVATAETDALWQRLTEFPATGDAPLTLKVSVPPSYVIAMVELILAADPNCSIQSHAGNGIIVARFAEFSSTAFSKVLIGGLQPAAQRYAGSVTVLRAANPAELTHQAAWGNLGDSAMLMEAVKRQFDPHGLFNPGRFVYFAQ